MLSGSADARFAEHAFEVLDGFPALLEGTQVPALAAAADNPETTKSCVEREATADGERLDDLVGAE
jgi:hypothetical protein